MTNQLQGEILFAGWEGQTSNPYAPGDEASWAHTPWMPVRGDIATFAVEAVAAGGTISLGWEIQTRTAEDGAIPTTIATGTALTGVGTSSVTNTTGNRAKQWVRYRFKTGSTPSTSNYIIFRALQPSWQVDR